MGTVYHWGLPLGAACSAYVAVKDGDPAGWALAWGMMRAWRIDVLGSAAPAKGKVFGRIFWWALCGWAAKFAANADSLTDYAGCFAAALVLLFWHLGRSGEDGGNAEPEEGDAKKTPVAETKKEKREPAKAGAEREKRRKAEPVVRRIEPAMAETEAGAGGGNRHAGEARKAFAEFMAMASALMAEHAELTKTIEEKRRSGK